MSSSGPTLNICVSKTSPTQYRWKVMTTFPDCTGSRLLNYEQEGVWDGETGKLNPDTYTKVYDENKTTSPTPMNERERADVTAHIQKLAKDAIKTLEKLEA
jgi:hypothetical protein